MRSDTQSDYRERILRVMVYIQNHLDDPLSLEDLAKVACFSPYHFHRIFRGVVGESVKEHVRRLRLERAAFRLTSSSRSVIEIALDAGYDTHESFTRSVQSYVRHVAQCLSAGLSKLRCLPDRRFQVAAATGHYNRRRESGSTIRDPPANTSGIRSTRWAVPGMRSRLGEAM